MWKNLLAFLIIASLSLTHSYDFDTNCGKIMVKKPNALSFNGTASYHGKWPWLVSLFHKEKKKYICGSSIITKWHLLSAAHCVVSENYYGFYARFGHFDLLNSNEPHEQHRDIQYIHVHEKYNTTIFQRSKGDIAIFKVWEEIQFNDYVQPVCLPQASANVIGMSGFLPGYGQTEPIQDSHENRPSNVKLETISNWDCLEKGLIYGNVISESSFCGRNREAIPCRGDSGGGFYVYDRATHRYSTYGVLSHAIGQCNPREYVVFVDVTKYITWINETIENEVFFDEIFKNPCDEIICGHRAECQVRNNKTECVCKSDFIGTPPHCIPKCFNDSSCPDNRACLFNICIDLCLHTNLCGENSQCFVRDHKIECECKSGYERNENNKQLCTRILSTAVPYTVHLGERAELNCNAEDNSMRTEWRRVDRQRLPQDAIIYGGQLIIENIGYDAAGDYECLAYDHYRPPITLLLTKLVVVSGPPKIVFSPPMPIAVRSGEEVKIECTATGDGPIKVHWHSEGLSSRVEVNGNQLRINKFSPADEGRYVCTASNMYGNTKKVAEIVLDQEQTTCATNEFRCKNGQCINNKFTCDDQVDWRFWPGLGTNDKNSQQIPGKFRADGQPIQNLI